MKATAITLMLFALSSTAVFAQRRPAPAPIIRPTPSSITPTAPVPEPAPARLVIAANGQSIIIDGAIARATASRFETLVNSAPGVRTVVLNSNGGWMDEAERVAQVVQEKGLNTYVEGVCRSACTLILIAGRDRAASPRAQIGFHRPAYFGSRTPAAADAYVSGMRSLYDRAGIARSFTDRTFATPYESMWYPSYQEMLSANVLTRQTLGGEAAVISTMLTSREEFVRIMGGLPMWEPFRRKFPDHAARIIDTAMAVRSRGGTDQEMFQAVRAIFEQSLPLILRDASDDLLLRYIRLSLEQALAARSVSEEACALLSQGRLNIAVTLPRELAERDAAIQAEALNSPQRPLPTIAWEEIEPSFGVIAAGMSAEQLNAVAEPTSAAPANIRCEGNIAFLRGILALPDEPRAQVIRWSLVQEGLNGAR